MLLEENALLGKHSGYVFSEGMAGTQARRQEASDTTRSLREAGGGYPCGHRSLSFGAFPKFEFELCEIAEVWGENY